VTEEPGITPRPRCADRSVSLARLPEDAARRYAWSRRPAETPAAKPAETAGFPLAAFAGFLLTGFLVVVAVVLFVHSSGPDQTAMVASASSTTRGSATATPAPRLPVRQTSPSPAPARTTAPPTLESAGVSRQVVAPATVPGSRSPTARATWLRATDDRTGSRTPTAGAGHCAPFSAYLAPHGMPPSC